MTSDKAVLRVLIADDHPVFRRGLSMIIAADARLEIVAEAADGTQAIERITEFEPEVVVLDVNMPDRTGFDVVKEMRRRKLGGEVIFLTMHKDEGMFNTAMDLGAKGYLLKESAIDEIVAGIKAVADGENFISKDLTTFLFNRSRRTAAFAETKPSINDLTKTERRILKLIADEQTSREISDALFISIRTVDRHRQNICDKMDIHGSNALMKFAIANKEQLL